MFFFEKIIDKLCFFFDKLCFFFDKVRLSKINSELTDQDYDALKEKCKKIRKKKDYGTKRFSYISTDLVFKTTVFGSQIKEFFNSLLDVRHEPFEEYQQR